jgi:large subunit ribosomal protein L9
MARVKVLLIDDVPELGLAGEVYTVAGGFARNYLMPRGMAIIATKGAMKQAEEIRQAGIRRRAKMRAGAEAQAQVIAGKKLLFEANAGDNDRLYGSVTASDIAEKLEEVVGFEIDRRKIQLGAALRDLGIHDLMIRIMPEVESNFQVAVVREGETWADAEARVKAKAEAAEAEAKAKAEADATVAAEEAAAAAAIAEASANDEATADDGAEAEAEEA